MMKSLIIAAVAAFTGFAALGSAQAVELGTTSTLSNTSSNAPVVLAGGVFYGDDYNHRPRHYRQRHQQNGFSLQFQFGQPNVYYEPRYPRQLRRHRPIINVTQAHVQWCYSRYRTYNHHSNSFVIRHGQRAYCVSPYSH